MSVRAHDLAYAAGGEILQSFGVLVRRTTPTEDVAETYTRSGTASRFDENGVVRYAAANTPRPGWRDLDGDGVPETAVLPLTGAQTNLVGYNVPGADEGRYYFDGTGDEISLGNWTGLDGAAAFSMLWFFAPGDISTNPVLFSRWDSSDNTKKQVYIQLLATGKLELRLATDLSGGTAYAQTSAILTDDVWTAVWIRYDGAGGTDADKIKIGYATFDAATTVDYGSFTEDTLSFSGTLPATLTTPSSAVNAVIGNFDDAPGNPFQGWVDDTRVHTSAAAAPATLSAQKVYDEPPGIWPHWWRFNGDATDEGATGGVDGTVSGAVQAADGRHGPVIAGKGGPVGVLTASNVVASSEGIGLPYDSTIGTKIVKLLTGASGSGTRRYRIGLGGSMNGFTASELAGMVVGVFIPKDSEVTAAQVQAYAVDDQGSTSGDIAAVRGRWCWLWVARTWDASATEAYFEVRVADGVSLTGTDEVVYLALATAVAGSVPLVPIPNTAAGSSAASGAETFYSTFDVPPVACGLYAKWKAWAPGGVLYVGAAGATGARVWIEQASDGKVEVNFTDGTDSVERIVDLVVTPGQEVRFFGVLTAEGTLTAHLRADGGSLNSTTASGSVDLPDEWGASRAYVGSLGGGSQGAVELLAAKVIRGSGYTLDEAEAVA